MTDVDGHRKKVYFMAMVLSRSLICSSKWSTRVTSYINRWSLIPISRKQTGAITWVIPSQPRRSWTESSITPLKWKSKDRVIVSIRAMSYKSNTGNDPKTKTLSGGGPSPDKEVSIHVAGFRKLRPALRLSRNMLNERCSAFQLTESQIIHKGNQNPWHCFKSQNETVPSVSEVIPVLPLERPIKSKDTELWQCFMPSGDSVLNRRRNKSPFFAPFPLIPMLYVVETWHTYGCLFAISLQGIKLLHNSPLCNKQFCIFDKTPINELLTIPISSTLVVEKMINWICC